MMRLIDADALDKKLFTDGFFGGLSGALNGYKTRRKFTIGEIRGMLSQAPTIEHVKRGAWVIDEFGHYCTSCHDYVPDPSKEEAITHSFCPNCGADMRNEAENGSENA